MGEAILTWNGGRIKRAIRTALGRALQEAGQDVEKEMRKVVGRPWPPASSPGEPPRRRSGNLQQSIVVRTNRTKLITTLSIGAEYWRFLEEGTVKMAPRPFRQVTLDRVLPKVRRKIRRKVKVDMKRFT